MDDGGPTASMILFVAMLLLTSLFYGFGSALLSLNGKEVEKKAEEGSKKAKKLLKMMENPTAFVNTLQLIVTVIHISMGGFYLKFWTVYIHNTLLTAVLMIALILSVGILIPKKAAAKYADRFAFFIVNPVYFLTVLFLPLTGVVSIFSNLVLRLFGIRSDEDTDDVTEEEIISMVNEGHEQGVLQASEAEMITNIFEFGDKEAKDIMTHRRNIVAIDGEMSLKEAIEFMLENNNSRYPVYEENIDHIIGILHMKDAMRMQSALLKQEGIEGLERKIKDINALIRKAKFIPETRNIDVLFQNMQSMKIQMVIVVDEYGQTMGLVAMEDILEEIVGNIMDEYDEEEGHIHEKGADQYEIDGMTLLEELEERFGIAFEEEEFDTLNGFLISKMDKIPETDDEQFEVTVAGHDFKVLSVENKMIKTVLVTRHTGAENPEQENEADKEK
ncbi:MAG: HlyC/CorC family transporter [Clostridiales bacterium]|nr:HlyC/CorC family transporter [Clostridiales bacterium]